MRDKALDKMIKILAPSASMVVCCKPRMERAADKNDFERYMHFSGKAQRYWIEDSTQAMRFMMNCAHSNDLICITGSLFLVGEVREFMLPVDRMASGRISL
jgi:dihydrofolate synthase/folylpolyglutamate synthase